MNAEFVLACKQKFYDTFKKKKPNTCIKIDFNQTIYNRLE